MTPSEIISAEMQAAGKDPAESLRAIGATINAGRGSLLHENNSVLFLRQISPSTAQLDLFTQDKPFTLARSLRTFVGKIRRSEIKKVYGADNPKEILEILKRMKVDVVKSDKPEFTWMAKV